MEFPICFESVSNHNRTIAFRQAQNPHHVYVCGFDSGSCADWGTVEEFTESLNEKISNGVWKIIKCSIVYSE